MSLFAELKRRNVFKVAVAYIVTAWLVLQVADVVLNNIAAPGWIFRVLLLFLAIGFAFALILAWAYELTPEGIKLKEEVDRRQSITTSTGRKLDRLIIGVLIVAIAFLFVDRFYLDKVTIANRDTTDAGWKSIAVLPFANLSDDSDHFADGLSEELLNLLAKNPELKVAGRTSSFSFKGRNEDLREIGDALNVEYVLEGSVRRSGGRLRITAQLVKVDDGFHVWSETYEQTMADIFDIQDDVARAISRELDLRLAPPADRPTENIDAYAIYLEGLADLSFTQRAAAEIAEALNRALDLDPNFAKVHELKAMAYWQAAGATMDAPTAQRLLYESAVSALRIDPTLPIANAYARISNPAGWSWVIEFDAIETAIAEVPNEFNLVHTWFYDLFLAGYFEEAAQVGRRMIDMEPLAELGYVRTGQALNALGRREAAHAIWSRGAEIIGEDWSYWDMAIDHIVVGDDRQGIEALRRRYEAEGRDPTEATEFVENARNSDTGKVFLDEWINAERAGQKYIWGQVAPYTWYLAFGYLDDFWRAVDLLEAQAGSGWSNADSLLTYARAFRASGSLRHPRFIELGMEQGLVDLWEKRGPPDTCSKINGEWNCE